jgi:hypothetical protein
VISAEDYLFNHESFGSSTLSKIGAHFAGDDLKTVF